MSTGNSEVDEYSVFSDADEPIITFSFFVMVPIWFGLAFAMFIVQSHDLKLLKTDNTFFRTAMKCAWIALLSTLLWGLTITLLCNDLIIGWDYTSSKHTFVTMSESFSWLFYQITKISFYFGFTFHFQSIIYSYKMEPLPLVLKILMLFVALYIIIASIVVIVDDALEYSAKEIGVTLKHNIYITMVVSHEKGGFNILELLALIMVVIDVLYFVILIYLYVSRLKQMDNKSKHKGVKALVLLIVSCIFFWSYLICIGLNLTIRYIVGVLDVMADVLCLFLLFKSGTMIYDNFCGFLCHNCCGRIFFGSNYKQLNEWSDVSDNADAQTDSLL